ncbi:MAG: hypothetical protein KIH69_007535 [Anaerolineae bacterium]|nr:hypothetical protein [Anaerolineae bacterium]
MRLFAPHYAAKILIGLSALVAAALLILVFRPLSVVFETPLSEDGFYMLAVSRYVALGQGITIDGQHATNGFQPLFAAIMVPIYWLLNGDRYTSLRGVLLVHWLSHIGTALLLGRIASHYARFDDALTRRAAFGIVALLWLASRHVIINSYNALETGLVMFFEALVWFLYQRNWRHGWRLWVFGIVLGLMVLARIDAVFLVVLLAGFELFRQDTPLRQRFLRAAQFSLVAGLVSSPWWIYNLIGFGSLMPTSGSAQSLPFSPTRIRPMLEALLQNAVPYVHWSGIDGTPKLILQSSIVIGIIGLFAFTQWRRKRHPDDEHGRHIGLIMLLFMLALAGYYIATSFAYYFYPRYLSPLMMGAVMMTGLALARLPRLNGLLLPIYGGLALIAMLSVYRYCTNLGESSNKNYTDQYVLIQNHVPPDAIVSAGQSGTVGYFRDHVLNLDGKVNQEALTYRGRIWQYLDAEKINWYCDWSTIWIEPEPEKKGWQLVERKGYFMLYKRVPPLQ